MISPNTDNISTIAWDTPQNIACIQITQKKKAQGPWQLNPLCASHPTLTEQHRHQLQQKLQLSAPIPWLIQEHSNKVSVCPAKQLVHADASYSRIPALACAVFTADCIPLLLCHEEGTEIAAVHAGWRGLSKQVIAHTFGHFQSAPHKIKAYIGPCITAKNYTVNADFCQHFIAIDPDYSMALKNTAQRWHADLRLIAKIQLQKLGIEDITISPLCTYEHESMPSYRKDGNERGTLTHIIYKKP